MTSGIPSGSGYRLEFEFQPPLLTARVSEGNQRSQLAVIREYWERIAAEVRASGAGTLLMIDAMPGDVLEDADLVQLFEATAGLGLEAVRIGYVKLRLDQIPRIEYAELMALERGYTIRMFSNESDARLWLRYGGD